jgi:hypothetical protein
MTNFDFKKYLAEGKLHEAMFDVATTEKIAQAVADAFTAEDNELDLKYKVTPGTGENSFDLDVEAGPNTPGEDWKDVNGFGIDNYLGDFAGGSFYIKDGVVYNAAMRNAPVANVSAEGEVEMISAEDSRAAIGMKESKEKIKSNKMKKSELKEMIKMAMMAEIDGSAVEAEDYDPVMEADEEVEDEETVDVAVDDTETIDTETTAEIDPNVKTAQDALTQAMEAARQLGDKKLQDQIGNTITFFTRAHVANTETGTMAESEESLNEDLTSTITILLAFLIGIPGVPIAGALMMGLVDYIFNGLPDQYNEYRSLKSYKGSDKQEEILALAKEIESKLSPGKKRYLKTLVNRIGVAKLEDKARAYRELDRYASGRELDENLNADIESALKDLPVPTDMGEGNKKYYKDAEADDAEHIKALEKDMKDDKESSLKLGEVMFPMWTKIQK